MENLKGATIRSLLAATTIVLILAGLAVGLRVTRASDHSTPEADGARQVTVFAVIAVPDMKGTDSKLSTIKAQLERLLPRHGFKVLDVQSKRLVAGESLGFDLEEGPYSAQTSLISPEDENGKVEIRCELWSGKIRVFSSQVKTPPNQLFFCERALKDGSRLLIGIGAR